MNNVIKSSTMGVVLGLSSSVILISLLSKVKQNFFLKKLDSPDKRFRVQLNDKDESRGVNVRRCEVKQREKVQMCWEKVSEKCKRAQENTGQK